MDISRVFLDEEHQALLNEVSKSMEEVQLELDLLSSEYEYAINQLNKVKAKIKPLKAKLSPLSELQASITSRKSRAKYFPEFATRNFDDSKDQLFLEFARQAIPGKD